MFKTPLEGLIVGFILGLIVCFILFVAYQSYATRKRKDAIKPIIKAVDLISNSKNTAWWSSIEVLPKVPLHTIDENTVAEWFSKLKLFTYIDFSSLLEKYRKVHLSFARIKTNIILSGEPTPTEEAIELYNSIGFHLRESGHNSTELIASNCSEQKIWLKLKQHLFKILCANGVKMNLFDQKSSSTNTDSRKASEFVGKLYSLHYTPKFVSEYFNIDLDKLPAKEAWFLFLNRLEEEASDNEATNQELETFAS